MAENKSHILVVDDEQLILESLTSLLEFDYAVHSADNGRTALELLQKHPIKVIMSDQRMPGMFGHELLRESKKISPNTIRVLLTGYSDLESVMYSVNAGEIFRYINKPWKSEMILRVFETGVQMYDKLAELTKQHQSPPSTNPQFAPIGGVKKNVHIEVDEKSGSVLFVGYKNNEVDSLSKQLEKRFEVMSSSNIDEALQQIAKKPVSVIVSDVKFENLDGFDFLSTIKSEYPEIVTVILTEVVDANLAIRSINELNVYKYLTKPIEQNSLEQILVEAAAKSRTYKEIPQSNLHSATQALTKSDPAAPKTEESIYRLKLRAAQAALAKRVENKG